jgi:Flp pilus assembly protein TadG
VRITRARCGHGSRLDHEQDDRGSVTVEAALVLAVLMVVVAACLAGIGCVIAQMRCVDAAREAARLSGRGDSAAAAAAVASIAPEGAVLTVRFSGDTVTATVQVGAVSRLLPGVSVGASATAVKEEGVTDG